MTKKELTEIDQVISYNKSHSDHSEKNNTMTKGNFQNYTVEYQRNNGNHLYCYIRGILHALCDLLSTRTLRF